MPTPDFSHLRTVVGVLNSLRELRHHDHLTADEVATAQAAGLDALRRYAYKHSPFYRSFHRALATAPLRELPVLTKANLMANFDELVTDPAVRLADARQHLQTDVTARFRGRYETVATSGSTGSPGIFLFDPTEWRTIIASFGRAREWAGLRVRLLHRSKMTVVSSESDQNLSARVGRAANTPFMPTLRLDAVRPIDDIVGQLNGWQPEVLVAYASMAHLLALEQRERLNIAPRFVFTSSEVLTPHMRSTIEGTWGPKLFNEFAATETATIGAECPEHHGLHLPEDLLIVENVDADNRPVPPGEFGDKLLVTTLFSRTQPLIRYELTDSVRFAPEQPPCRLPYAVIDEVQGRTEDTLIIDGVTIRPGVFHDAMDLVPNQAWQVRQDGPSSVHVLLASASEADRGRLPGLLLTALRQHGVRHAAVTVESVPTIPKTASGKAPLIKAATQAP